MQCDGNTPCSMCRSTGALCVYNPNDWRRQRHQRSSKRLKQRTADQALANPDGDGPVASSDDTVDTSACIGDAATLNQDPGADSKVRSHSDIQQHNCLRPEENEQSINVSSAASPGRLKTQDTGSPGTKLLPTIGGTTAHFQQTRIIKPSHKGRDRQDNHPEPGVLAMNDMQGKFYIRARNFSHNFDAGTSAKPISVL